MQLRREGELALRQAAAVDYIDGTVVGEDEG